MTMSTYEVQLVDDVGSTIHHSQHDEGSTPLWLQLGRYEETPDESLSVLAEEPVEPTSLCDGAHAVLNISFPAIQLEALRAGVKVQPRGIQSRASHPWQLIDLAVSSSNRRILTYVRPDDEVNVAGFVFTIDVKTKQRSQVIDGEHVQVNSSIPGLDDRDAHVKTRESRDVLGLGRFTAPPLLARSRTPTQASNGPTVEETPANHQRKIDAEARPQRLRSSQLYDSLHRNHVPSDALISSPHDRRSPIKFEDEESQDAVDFSTATSTMQPLQRDVSSKLDPEPADVPDAPAVSDIANDEPEVEAAKYEQPEDNDETSVVNGVVHDANQQDPQPSMGGLDMETSADDFTLNQVSNQPPETAGLVEPAKRFEGTLADAGDDEQTESEDEGKPTEPQAPQVDGKAVSVAKAVSPIDEGESLAPPAKRGRKRKAVSEGKMGVAKKRRSNSTGEAEKGTPARSVSVVIKSAKRKTETTQCPASSAGSTRKSPRQQSANGDHQTGEDRLHGKRIAFSNSSVLDIISVKKFFGQKSLKQVDKLTNTNYDILVVGRGEMKKTSKLLKSLLLHKPIATEAWLLQSEKAGHLLNPANFEPADLDVSVERDKLLVGRHIVVTVPLRTDYGSGYKEVAELAKLAGAESVVSKPKRDCKSKPEESIVLGLEKEDLEARNFFEHGFTCYTRELLSTSILRGVLNVEDDEFKIKMSPSQARKAKGKTKTK